MTRFLKVTPRMVIGSKIFKTDTLSGRFEKDVTPLAAGSLTKKSGKDASCPVNTGASCYLYNSSLRRLPHQLNQPTHLRALRHSCIHGLSSLLSSGVQLIWMLRNTRSGCGIMAVKRPSAVVTAVRPPALPLGLAG